MRKLFVRQPNGLFAVYNTLVDDFMEIGLTRLRMREVAALDFGLSGKRLEQVVADAETDRPIWDGEDLKDGKNRWRETSERMSFALGPHEFRRRMRQCCA